MRVIFIHVEWILHVEYVYKEKQEEDADPDNFFKH